MCNPDQGRAKVGSISLGILLSSFLHYFLLTRQAALAELLAGCADEVAVGSVRRENRRTRSE